MTIVARDSNIADVSLALTRALIADGECVVVGVDVARDRVEFEVVGLARDGEPIAWHIGDIRGMLSGPYARPGWASRCLDPATALWETFRLGRRARRRQRGRARAARRAPPPSPRKTMGPS